MKHTKGNWITSENWIKNIPCIRANGNIIAELPPNEENGITKEEAEANAKIIHAAPLMLQTLQETFKRLWELRDSDTICDQDREIIIDIETTMLDAMVKAGYENKNANA